MDRVTLITKIEFCNKAVAARASVALGGDTHALLGSAVIVPMTVYNSNYVSNLCADLGGYFADEVTDFDCACVS